MAEILNKILLCSLFFSGCASLKDDTRTVIQSCLIEIYPYVYNIEKDRHMTSVKDLKDNALRCAKVNRFQFPDFEFLDEMEKIIYVECPKSGFIVDLRNMNELKKCTALLKALVNAEE